MKIASLYKRFMVFLLLYGLVCPPIIRLVEGASEVEHDKSLDGMEEALGKIDKAHTSPTVKKTVIPPLISNVSTSKITASSALVTWETDKPATSQIEYGPTSAYGTKMALGSNRLTNHSILLTDLDAGTTYNFRVKSTDAAGNEAISSNFTLVTLEAGASSKIRPGGLVAYPYSTYELGPNLLENGSFEEVDPTKGYPVNWFFKGFSPDATVAHTGSRSFLLKDAYKVPGAPVVRQKVSLKKGTYQISGWVKLDGMALDKKGEGVRLSLRPAYNHLAGGTSTIIGGTSDWQYLEARHIVITQDTEATFGLEAYGRAEGTAWFDDVELKEELALPLEVFMLYPNYRGILFDDQSQSIRFDIAVNPPPNTGLSDYHILITVMEEAEELIVANETFQPVSNFVVELDGSAFLNGHTYLARFYLVRTSDNLSVYEYPPYRISKEAGSKRPSMTMSFDEHNRFLIHGEPAFILGVYDAGWAPAAVQGDKKVNFMKERRLFELPINCYLNYMQWAVPANKIRKMMDVLQKYGILYFHNGNCFQEGYPRDQFPIHNSDNHTLAVGSHPGLAGFYVMDECYSELAPQVFEDYQRLKNLDPDGITLGVSNLPRNLSYWREVVDVLGTDPYPMYGAEPEGGYRFSQVADWSRQTREVLKSSRPFITVIQFFKFTAKGRWPTRDELRNMSYMAIVEGANGLFYWSIGARALAWVCKEGSGVWCAERVEYFERLKAVMNELKSLEPAFLSIDRPDLLIGNSNPTSIRTCVKFAEEKGYLIAYNYTNETTSATFTWKQALANVSVYNESRSIVPAGQDFTDTFGPYQAHVYVITVD
jgi:hypothetical protein